jgi:uncharacterized protein YndB with AHSA1/START domain
MILATLAALALADPPLRAELRPLEFLVGHCWEGTLPDGKSDRHCFESVYGGQHIRDHHVVSAQSGGPGVYSGETFYSAAGNGRLAFVYFNSIGGVSQGSLGAEPDRLNFGEEHYRGPDGRQITLSVSWRRVGDDAYEAITTSTDAPRMNGTVRYRRVAAVTISEASAPDGTRSLTHEITIPAPVEQVYGAFATAEGWKSWAVPHAWDVPGSADLIETSYAPDARLGNPANIRQLFLARVPNRLLVFRTVQFPPGFPDAELYARTTGVAEFEAVGGSTRVRLTGSGYPPGETGTRLLAFFREGNRASLEQLRARFVTGPVDWTARQRASAR